MKMKSYDSNRGFVFRQKKNMKKIQKEDLQIHSHKELDTEHWNEIKTTK